MNVDNCNDEECEVKRSVPAKMQLTFKTIKEATKLSGEAKALVAGSWFPWPLGGSSDVCKNLIKGSCPIPANSEATYALIITIPNIAPIGFKSVVQIRVTDQDKNVVACTRFPVHVIG